MSLMTIRDDALWVKHVQDADLRGRIASLAAGSAIRLIVAGEPISFRKMRDGKDGRPTPGLRADPDDRDGTMRWTALQSRRGEEVPVAVDEHREVDPYLAYLDELFWEWKTPEDCEAFDDL